METINNQNTVSINEPKGLNSREEENRYPEIIRRLTSSQREWLDDAMSTLYLDREVRCLKLAKDFNAHRMDAISSDPDCPLLGLWAVKLGYLSQHQFGTLMQFWGACQCHLPLGQNVTSMPLFDSDGKVNSVARTAIVQTLQMEPVIVELLGKTEEVSGSLLTEEQVDLFFEAMREQEESEQQCFVVPDIDPYDLDALERVIESGIANDAVTVSHSIRGHSGLNLFCRFEEKGIAKRMVPSFGMMQVFLNVRHGPDAVHLNPVLGTSTSDDLRKSAMLDWRDVGIPFPSIPLPPYADNFRAPHYDFAFHDACYHAILASSMSRKDRQLMLLAADIATKVALQAKSKGRQAGFAFSSLLVDLENNYYRPEFRALLSSEFSGNAELFWLSLNLQFLTWRQTLKPQHRADAQKVERQIMKALVKTLPKQDTGLSAGPARIAKAAQQVTDSWELNGKAPIVQFAKLWNRKHSVQ